MFLLGNDKLLPQEEENLENFLTAFLSYYSAN